MKFLVLFSLCFLSLNTFSLRDPKIGGTILEKGLTNNSKKELVGSIKLILKKAEQTVASLEIKAPVLPQAFGIGPKNMIEQGRPFKGPFTLQAYLYDESKKLIKKTQKVITKTGIKDVSLFLEN